MSRRQALRFGLAISATGLLAACGSKRSALLPMPVWNNTTAANAADVEAQRQQLEALRNKSLETAHVALDPTALSSFEINPRSMTASTRPIASRMYRHQSAYSRITIHHDGMPPVMLHSQSQNRERIRQIRNLHVNNNGWGDIGYHFIIDRNGQIWEGRPLKWQGAHVRNQNPGNLGVMCLGNFEIESPSHAQLETLASYVVALATHHRVPLRRIVTHQELASTLCPGRNLQRQVIAARRPRGSIAALL